MAPLARDALLPKCLQCFRKQNFCHLGNHKADVTQFIRVSRHPDHTNGLPVDLKGKVDAFPAASHLVNRIHIHFRDILLNQLAGGLVQRTDARWIGACNNAPFFIHDIDIAVQDAADALGNFL